MSADPFFFLVPYSDVLPDEVQWFWETVEEGAIPFMYVEGDTPRLDGHPVGEDDRRWVLSPESRDRVLYAIAVIAVDRAR